MIWIGTSGYSYAEWKGKFYPSDLPTNRMLPFYSERFRTVEINNTFYRMPGEELLEGWARVVPEKFKFSFKAPRSITHVAKLRDCKESVGVFWRMLQVLGPKLGTVLFQLPPFFKKDLLVLEQFIDVLPSEMRTAFEFRHDSWFDDEVFVLLKKKKIALCIAESEKISTPLVATTTFGYLRLRKENYQASDLTHWGEWIAMNRKIWDEAFVYFKHEEAGKGPEFARLLQQQFEVESSL